MTRPSIAAPAIALSIQQEKDGGLSHSATVNLPKWAEMHHFVYFHWDYIWLIHWLCSVQRDCRWNIVSGWLTDPEATCGSVISPPMNSVIYLPIYHFLIDPNVHNHIFFLGRYSSYVNWIFPGPVPYVISYSNLCKCVNIVNQIENSSGLIGYCHF